LIPSGIVRHQTAAAALASTLFVALAGCSSDATYDERMNYLRKVAQRGADTHTLIASQEANIDKPRCERAFNALNTDDEPYTSDTYFDGQIKEFFVDSCISGKPKPVPGDPAPSAPAVSSPVAPSLSPSA
jgi:hypothetical protein